MTNMRPHCLDTSACNSKSDKHCRSCAMKAINATPGMRERQIAGNKTWHADPKNKAKWRASLAKAGSELSDDARAARSKAGREFGKKNLELTRSAESRAKAGKAISAKKLEHIPPAYRDEYRVLVRSKALSKDEATAIIQQQIAAANDGARIVARIRAEMIAKHRRDLEQRY